MRDYVKEKVLARRKKVPIGIDVHAATANGLLPKRLQVGEIEDLQRFLGPHLRPGGHDELSQPPSLRQSSHRVSRPSGGSRRFSTVNRRPLA